MRVFLWEASALTCRRPAYLKLVCPNCSNLTKIQSCNSYTIYPDPNNECFTSFPKICKTILCFHPSLLVFTKTSCFAGVRCWQNIFTLHILCLSLCLSSSLSSCCNFLCHWLCICLPFCICGLAVSGESVCIACLSSHHCTMCLPMSIDISEVLKCKHSFHAHFK